MKSTPFLTTPSCASLIRRGVAGILALQALLLVACHEAPAPKVEAPTPIVQNNQIRFAPNHPQLALLSITAASSTKAINIELPAKLVWNEDRTQRLYASFAGRVAAIKADVGQSVTTGQALAVLASPEFGLAQADTAKARADLVVTQKALARQRELFDAGIVARKELDGAEADAARAAAESQRTEARIKLYDGASTGGVNQQLTLGSTLSGVVVERNINPGQELRPDQSGVGVPPLFVVTDPSSLWVQIDARESDIGSLKPGSNFEIAVPSLGGQVFQAVVKAAGDFIDPATRTIKVRGLVANPQRVLKAEMLVTARITRKMTDGSVSVPAGAALLNGAKHYVFVQGAAGTFEPREVELAYEGSKTVVVASGLKAGEQVVSENTLLLARLWRLSQDTAPSAVQSTSPQATASKASQAAPKQDAQK
jgi:cobalt-zinc-cadmium efflux system membrane fusion protein